MRHGCAWLLVCLITIAHALIAAQAPAKQPETALGSTLAGRQLLQQQNWKAARDKFEQSLKLNPNDSGAHIGLGIAAWGMGDHETAFAAFRRATEINPKSAEAHFNVALALKDSGQTGKAEAELQTALKLKPDYEEADLALALLLQQSGRLDEAVSRYRATLMRNPRSADAHNWLGVAYMQKNALADAISEFRKAIALKPDYVRAHNNLGSTLAQSGDLKAGIDAFEAGLKHAPSDTQLHLNLGLALGKTGNSDDAIRHFKFLADRDPENAEVQHQLGQTLRQKGDLGAAIQSFENALRLNPEMREAYYGLGLTLKQAAAVEKRKLPDAAHRADAATQRQLNRGSEDLAKGDTQAAKDWFEKAIQSDPECAEAYNLLGFVLGRTGDLRSAVEKLDKAVALNPGLAEAHYNRGVAHWYSADRTAGLKELDAAVRLNPALGEAYGFLGMALREFGNLDGARRMLQRAIALNPKVPSSYVDLGLVLLKQRQLGKALGQFEASINIPGPSVPLPDLEFAVAEVRRALKDQPDNAEAHNILGRLLGLGGAESKQVLSEFSEAIRLRPEYAEAHNNRGLVYTQIGDDEKAIASFREAIRQRPDYADAHGNLGAVLTATDASESVRELEKALQLQPDLLKAQYNLAVAYGSSPAYGIEKEIEQLRQVVLAEPDFIKAQLALGKAFLRKGLLKDAIVHLQQATRLDPNFGEAHYQLGLALSRAGQQQEAKAEIEKGRALVAADQRRQNLSLDLTEGKEALAKGDLTQAVAKLRQLAAVQPDAPEAQYQLGLALAASKNVEGATAAYRKTLKLVPTHQGAKENLNNLTVAGLPDSGRMAVIEGYIRDKRYTEAEPLLLGYVQKQPGSPWGWYALGYVQFSQQKLGDSVKSLAKSLQLDLNNANAHEVLGRSLMIIGRFDAAQIEFEQAARLNPKSAEVRQNLGKLFSIQDNWGAAKQQFEEAIRLDTLHMEAYDGLGLALEALADDSGAIANYQKAIRLNEERKGNFSAPYVNLSAHYNKLGNSEAALEYAHKALAVNPKSDAGLFQLAKAQERREELNAAVDSLIEAISINPRSSSYHYVLGTLYRRLGKNTESREAFYLFRKLEQQSSEIDQKKRDAAKGAPVRISTTPKGAAIE